MKKEYISPEFELIRITLSDVLNSSPVTENISDGSGIGGGSGSGDEDPIIILNDSDLF